MFAGEDQLTEDEGKEEKSHSYVTSDLISNHVSGLEDSGLDSETELMKKMGLPIQFGSVAANKALAVEYSLFFFCGIINS